MTIKTRIHHNFAQLGDFIYRFPKATLIAALAIAVFCCAWLGQLRIDTSNESTMELDVAGKYPVGKCNVPAAEPSLPDST